MKMYEGSGYIDGCFLDLSTSWRWVVSIMPWLLNAQGKKSSDRRLG
jgi:hypothetical protein